jgi:uncharacterized protein (DUF362 family)
MQMKEKQRIHGRREFIKAGAGVCAFSALSSSLAHARNPKDYPAYYLDRPINFEGPEPLPPTRVYPAMDHATVGMRGLKRNRRGRLDFETVLAAVREVVEAAGGLSEIERGQRVMIKPNMVGPIAIAGKGRITTNPLVVRAVIRLVKERGAEAMVGDRGLYLPQIPNLAGLTFQVSGILWACLKEGAQPFPWERSEYVRFFPKMQHWSKGFRMPKVLRDADHFINVPVLKNHETNRAEYTCCMKSYVGVLHPADRGGEGLDAFHAKNISEKIAEANLCAKPLINIVDATKIMVRGGPGDGLVGGDPTYKVAMFDAPDLVMASKDRVACDSVALSVLKLYGAENQIKRTYVQKSVWDQVQIYYAAQLGLGQAEPDKITIEDIEVPRFDEIRANWV